MLGDKESCQRKRDFLPGDNGDAKFRVVLPMKLTEIAAPDLDLAMTLNSGQVFHWEPHGEGFVGAIGDCAAYVEQRGNKLAAQVQGGAPRRQVIALARSGAREFAPPIRNLIADYFALDHRLDEICASFPDEPLLNKARDYCRGLRIIRQPKWECLATFICSSMKQVSHIRQISHALRKRFGEKRIIYGIHVYLFPDPARVARASEAALQRCGLGYRARNLSATARHVAAGEVDLERWTQLPNAQLREKLCELPGVGPKVANCVMLFAYERTAAFPIDVWIERVLREKYFVRKRKVTGQMLADFAANYFGAHGGYAQQYLFHHARMTRMRKSRSHAGAEAKAGRLHSRCSGRQHPRHR